MSQRRVMFIGKTGCGKTTLCQKLHDQQLAYHKTQAVSFFDQAIDTPGEYLENRHFYSALMVSACDAGMIALVVDPTAPDHLFPPGFAQRFNKPVVGIVTKIGLVGQQQIDQARAQLIQSGAEDIYLVDTIEGMGVEALRTVFDL